MSLFFSVVIPSYNRADHISGVIQSFLAQEHQHFEVLVVDDGSTDNTAEVVRRFTDPRIKYYSKKNEERGATRNYGAALAKGDYITFFDSDDIVYPWYFSHAASQLEQLGKPECYAQLFEFKTSVPTHFTKPEKPFPSTEIINSRLAKDNFLACNGVFVRNDIFKAFKFSGNRDLSGSEDWVLWLQLAANYDFHYSPVACSCLILHANRGEENIVSSKLILRLQLLLSTLENDEQLKKFKPAIRNKMLSSGYLFAALKLADFNKFKSSSIYYLWRGFKLDPGILSRRNMYVTERKIMFKWNKNS